MTNRRLSQYLLCVIALIIAVQSVRLLSGQTKKVDSRKSTASPELQKQDPAKNPAAKYAPDASLSAEIERLIKDSEVQQTRIGIYVISMSDGRVIYSRDGDKLFLPASNMKVYTTAVALDVLGADYRWRTSVFASNQPDTSGLIDGNLTLYGRGAPDLVSKAKGDLPSLAKLADQLYQSGVRHVRGNVIGDESYFRGELFGIGWQWNDLQWYFGAQPSALSIDENSVEVTIAPASKKGSVAGVAVNPNDGFVHLANNTTTADRDATTSIGINRELSSNDVRVWGDFPVAGHAFSAFLSVHNPALWAATTFKQMLIARGIKVDGEAWSRDFRVAETEKFDPQKAVELAYQDSEPLSDIVRKTNKESNNLFAELILRTIGKERGPTAPDPDQRKNRERGDDEAGAAVVKAWLERNGIATRPLAIHDGSGLSRLDLVTPESTARLLMAIAKTNAGSTFHDSLPVAGRDGTLGGRLKNLEGKIVAKTGSLTYVHSLSGYAATPSGEVRAFSILCNDTPSDRSAIGLIDKIAGAIAGTGQPASSK